MSVFSGKQGRGAMRRHHAKKVEDAFRRQLAIWNDGTGMYQRRPTDVGLTRVANPIINIPRVDRHMYLDQYPKLFSGYNIPM
jgi:hypothetical protein